MVAWREGTTRLVPLGAVVAENVSSPQSFLRTFAASWSGSEEDTRVYEPSAVLVTGVQAAGKSTVGRLLAERFEYSAFIEGDDMWRLIVRGRVDMSPDPDPEAIRPFELRLKHGAMLVDSLVDAGFTAVHADLVFEGFCASTSPGCAAGPCG